MDADLLARALADAVPLDTLRQFRPPRAAIVLPILRALAGNLRGLDVVELGSGEPLLLAKALADEGARVTAIDPALSDPRVEPGPVRTIADDVFSLAPDAIAAADLTISTLLFGAPLRQLARRRLWDEYRAGRRPSEARVHAELVRVEEALVGRLARWTRPGGWTLHVSLERLFAMPPDAWRAHGFEPLALGTHAAPGQAPLDAARHALAGMVVARRSGGGSASP